MDIKVLEETKNRIVIEFDGVGHTFLSALKDELWQEPSVEAAAYNFRHPLNSKPHFIVETKGKDPKSVLIAAAKKLQKKNDKFAELAKAELK